MAMPGAAVHEGDARVASRYLFEALSLTERLGHRWLQHEPLALLATTLLPHDPVRGTEILGSLEAERRRDRRVLRAIVAEVIDSAWADLAEHQDPHEIDAARRRGERMPFEEALERGCDAARVALHRSRRSDSDEGRATAVDAVGLMSSGG